jgi:uncharacterized protein DUF6220
MSQARVIYFGLAAIYLAATVVQFFLAGLGAFGADPDYGAHAAVGFFIGIGSIVLLVVVLVARLPRTLVLLNVLLVGLNVLQVILANAEVDELEALHPVSGLAIVALAHELMQRSRRYLTSKMAA